MILAFILILSAVAYRIAAGLLIHSGATWLSNFAPLVAIALCGAAYFSPKFKFSIPPRAAAVSEFSRLVKLALRTDIKNETHALISALDKAARRGIIHCSAANPRKARLNPALSGATLAAEPQQPRKIPAG